MVAYQWPQQIRVGTRPSRAETEWSSWADQHQARFISLFPLFVNDTPANELIAEYYWENDAHWNEVGHAKVAKELLNQLVLPSAKK
ncbi:hypothetical protein EBX31_07985 [bacterium]|nr:hypothetical protein [bacterium]